MIYRVVLDGYDIYGSSPELSLVSPTVTASIENSGSAEFTMPSNHSFYNFPKRMTSDVEIYEEDKLIWYGRVLNVDVDTQLNKKISCKGAYDFFNDTIQRPQIITESDVHTIFQTIITNHNGQVRSTKRQFTVGDITVENSTASAEMNYETTRSLLDNLRSSIGGYFLFRKENGVNIIDWLAELPETSTQPVMFGFNLIDISQSFSGADLYTSIIPLGKEVNGAKLTISDENSGLDYLDSDAVDEFGRITTVVEFSDITSVSDLKEAGEKWLESQKIGTVKIQCNAADMHYLNGDYAPFQIGQYVPVVSEPHLVDKILPLYEMTINMDSAVKKISVGTPEKDQLTKM